MIQEMTIQEVCSVSGAGFNEAQCTAFLTGAGALGGAIGGFYAAGPAGAVEGFGVGGTFGNTVGGMVCRYLVS